MGKSGKEFKQFTLDRRNKRDKKRGAQSEQKKPEWTNRKAA